MHALSNAYKFDLLNRKWQQLFTRRCRECGLDLTRLELMTLLLVYREEGCIQGVLEDRLCIDRAVVTRVVHSLENKGLVFRERDGTDNRKKHVYLTKEGKARWPFFQNMIVRMGDYFEEALLPEDIEAAARIIDALVARVVKADSSVLRNTTRT